MEQSSKKRKSEELQGPNTKSETETKQFDFQQFVSGLTDTNQISEYVKLLKTRQLHIQNDDAIREEVKTQGFAIRTQCDYAIDGLEHMQLPLRVKILSYNRDLRRHRVGDVTVEELVDNDEQPEWAKKLKVMDVIARTNWERTNIDSDMEFDDITEEWDYGDWDSPITGTGEIQCTFYFVAPPFPDIARAFSILDENNGITTYPAGECKITKEKWENDIVYFIGYE